MEKLNGSQYRLMLLYGSEILNAHKDAINALNVFPVPDGDTGSNMNMTAQSGISALNASNANSIGEVSKIFSKGLLMGARGNSGVILSQFFRGVSEGLHEYDTVSVTQFHEALQQGVKRAYSSIIKPVEGTILTVVREMVENTPINNDFITYFETLYNNALTSLKHTPELLPVLKEVGVVDSGGAGFLAILHGMMCNIKGETIEIKQNFDLIKQTEHTMAPEDIVYGFCTEMLINLNDKADEDKLLEIRSKLETFGDSIVCIIDDGVLKVHVHTETPIEVFKYGSSFGTFINIKSENMRIQAENAQKNKEPQKDLGIVSVCSSEAMGDLFRQIYEDITIIPGGQTLNPSTQDILKMIELANAKEVILFPNNSNIILSAQTCVDLIKDCKVHIINTKHMTQGLECLINFDVNLSIDENIKNMNEIKDNMINIEITNATKDTTINGLTIKQNDNLVIINGDIKYANANIEVSLQYCFDYLINNNCNIITCLVGQDGNYKLITKLANEVIENHSDLEIDIEDTKQPVYSYLISGIE